MDIESLFLQIVERLDWIADSKGALRAGLIYDVLQLVKGLKGQADAEIKKLSENVETLKNQIEILQKGVE